MAKNYFSRYVWLPVIVNAMRDRKAIQMTYQSFWKDEPHTFIVHPYCLKLFKQRWYMLGRSEDYDDPLVYALDERMINVIWARKGLKVVADQVKYVDTLPLHDSQVKILETQEYSVYQYHLVPKFDFRREILRWGPDVEVLCPEWFKEEVKADITQMYWNYGL